MVMHVCCQCKRGGGQFNDDVPHHRRIYALLFDRYSRCVAGTATSCSLYFAAGSRFEVDKGSVSAPQPKTHSSPGGAGKPHSLSDHIETLQEYRMSHADGHNGVVIITSEPLTTARADWVPVPENHIIVATPDKQVILSPLKSKHFQCLGAEQAIQESRDSLEMLDNLHLFDEVAAQAKRRQNAAFETVDSHGHHAVQPRDPTSCQGCHSHGGPSHSHASASECTLLSSFVCLSTPSPNLLFPVNPSVFHSHMT